MQPRARGPNSFGQSKSIQLERALRSLSPVGVFTGVSTLKVIGARNSYAYASAEDSPYADGARGRDALEHLEPPIPTCAGGLSLSLSLSLSSCNNSEGVIFFY